MRLRCRSLLLAAALAAGCGGAATPSTSATPCWPLMSDPQPRGTLPFGTRSTTLSMTTDRDAVCRFATEEGLVYATMDRAFAITGGTRHSLPVDGLADGGFYRMYAKCEAAATGCATPHDLIFIFNVATSAALADEAPADRTRERSRPRPPERPAGSESMRRPAGS